MPVTVNIDIAAAQDALNIISFMETAPFGEVAGPFAVASVILRTRSGHDINDVPFEAYATNSRIPDLYDTGAMLGSLSSNSSGDMAATVECASDIAQYHEEGTQNMPQRQFMGLSEADIKDLAVLAFLDPLAELLG